jgi:hypothetical protein
MTNLLGQFHTRQTPFAEMAHTIMELNNQLSARMTIAEGTSVATAGPTLGDSLNVHHGETKSFVIRLGDPTGRPLAGYAVQLEGATGADFAFSPPGEEPAVRHGRVTSGALHRATDADGAVIVTYQAPPHTGTATLRASYQPDFDSDASLAPPTREDDLETLLRKHYLYALRGVAKVWRDPGNFGARVSQTVTLNIQA